MFGRTLSWQPNQLTERVDVAAVDSEQEQEGCTSRPGRLPTFRLEAVMTEVLEPTEITEALAIIDASLGGLTARKLVSADEVTDLLLDVRAILKTPPAAPLESTDG